MGESKDNSTNEMVALQSDGTNSPMQMVGVSVIDETPTTQDVWQAVCMDCRFTGTIWIVNSLMEVIDIKVASPPLIVLGVRAGTRHQRRLSM